MGKLLYGYIVERLNC